MPVVNPPIPPHTWHIHAHEIHFRDKDSLGGRTPLAYIY